MWHENIFCIIGEDVPEEYLKIGLKVRGWCFFDIIREYIIALKKGRAVRLDWVDANG